MVEPPHLRSKVGMWRGDDRQSFIEIHSWNFLRKATSISALFTLHVRLLQEQYIRGLFGKPEERELRCWQQSGNEEKRKYPEIHKYSVVHLLRKRI